MPLVVVQPQSLLAEQFTQHAAFGLQVVDDCNCSRLIQPEKTSSKNWNGDKNRGTGHFLMIFGKGLVLRQT
ncbi:MAG: hypothetical protein HZA46_08070 [Planctomycetales bacterium]|nr:hypothetical protein [Planctomycetales bacterium]